VRERARTVQSRQRRLAKSKRLKQQLALPSTPPQQSTDELARSDSVVIGQPDD
jgi:hypothetical protein